MKYLYHFLLLVFVFALLKSSDEQILEAVNTSFLSGVLKQWDVGNNIIHNISMGYIVSYIFWAMNIAIPKWSYKRELKLGISRQFLEFKKDVFRVLFNAHKYSIITYKGYDVVRPGIVGDSFI